MIRRVQVRSWKTVSRPFQRLAIEFVHLALKIAELDIVFVIQENVVRVQVAA